MSANLLAENCQTSLKRTELSNRELEVSLRLAECAEDAMKLQCRSANNHDPDYFFNHYLVVDKAYYNRYHYFLVYQTIHHDCMDYRHQHENE